ncbi:SMI1/KNR4 family protein [Chitinophaga filiformis]|uniref:SMI1/KNR4 family protein n=1 Tax=Chitinophaga filiformis TaxID=104663 RepID=UPI0021D43449|nr:SMI1/KNR4 family protein [Chitinophaga filiformis]
MQEYVDHTPSDNLIVTIEEELGFKLPTSYIELMKLHNGGVPKKTSLPTSKENLIHYSHSSQN